MAFKQVKKLLWLSKFRDMILELSVLVQVPLSPQNSILSNVYSLLGQVAVLKSVQAVQYKRVVRKDQLQLQAMKNEGDILTSLWFGKLQN